MDPIDLVDPRIAPIDFINLIDLVDPIVPIDLIDFIDPSPQLPH
jgi:hypothetical protein